MVRDAVMIADLKPYAEYKGSGLLWHWGLIPNRRLADRGDLAQDRGERDADRGDLAPEILAAIGQLGARPRKERLRAVIATI
ncbi:hypothetical protein RZS08_67045, partial [Arthrospira platensis SPKY1]|nr:hypothetical protein [Arthrospira platensis SPKY1]